MLAATRAHALVRNRYPRANAYDPSWVFANEMGPNALWLMEWLCAAVDLQPGMRVLYMGCGRAMTRAAQALNRHWQQDDIEVLAADGGRYLGFIRVVGRRRGEAA